MTMQDEITLSDAVQKYYDKYFIFVETRKNTETEGNPYGHVEIAMDDEDEMLAYYNDNVATLGCSRIRFKQGLDLYNKYKSLGTEDITDEDFSKMEEGIVKATSDLTGMSIEELQPLWDNSMTRKILHTPSCLMYREGEWMNASELIRELHLTMQCETL
jgi:hypothetical protein